MKIYTSSYIDSEELNPDNFVEAFERYANKLEDVVKSYRTLVTYVKTKKIKIFEAEGYAHGGHFSVDDIDTARLKKEGIVIDFGDKPDLVENPTFYIDKNLDAVLEDTLEKLDKLEIDEEPKSLSYKDFSEVLDEDDEDEDFNSEDYDLTEEEESALFKFVEDDDIFGIEKIDIELDEIFPEKTTTFNLAEKLKMPDTDDPLFVPGNMIIDVHKLDTDKYAFNLAMADLNEHPKHVNYIREKSLFEYNCGECSNTHFETLDSIYTSLKTANAILSNLIEMSRDSRELSTALEFIDSDLRLLQWLLKLDYALEDEHDHEDEHDEEDEEE
jgi:hypothetical protein